MIQIKFKKICFFTLLTGLTGIAGGIANIAIGLSNQQLFATGLISGGPSATQSTPQDPNSPAGSNGWQCTAINPVTGAKFTASASGGQPIAAKQAMGQCQAASTNTSQSQGCTVSSCVITRPQGSGAYQPTPYQAPTYQTSTYQTQTYNPNGGIIQAPSTNPSAAQIQQMQQMQQAQQNQASPPPYHPALYQSPPRTISPALSSPNHQFNTQNTQNIQNTQNTPATHPNPYQQVMQSSGGTY